MAEYGTRHNPSVRAQTAMQSRQQSNRGTTGEGDGGAGMPARVSVTSRTSGRAALAAAFPTADEAMSPFFWGQQGDGNAVLRVIALAHIGVGLFAALVGVYAGIQSNDLNMALAGGVGLLLALTAGVALLLARSMRASANEAARHLLPVADGVACVAALLLLGDRGIMGLLFLAPIVVAAVLLSWRSGAAFAALDVGVYAAISAVRSSSTAATIYTWIPQTLALTGAAIVVSASVGVFARQMSVALYETRSSGDEARKQLESRVAEQQRLLDGLTLLEETQARLEHERIQVNQQITEIAGVARRLSDGDLNAARTLRPGMYGPLDLLGGALMRLGQQMAGTLGLRQQVQAQQRTFDHLQQVMREQEHLIAEVEAALRELNTKASELVADVQLVQRGSDELPGLDRHALFGALRGVEQEAMTQASNTALLGARLSQLRARQADLETEVQRVRQFAGGLAPSSQPGSTYGFPTFPGSPSSNVSNPSTNPGMSQPFGSYGNYGGLGSVGNFGRPSGTSASSNPFDSSGMYSSGASNAPNAPNTDAPDTPDSRIPPDWPRW